MRSVPATKVQTDLARLIRCLLYGQTRKQRNKNINNFICFPARAQAFSWLCSVTGLQSKRGKNNCSKSSFVQTSSRITCQIFVHSRITLLFGLISQIARLGGEPIKFINDSKLLLDYCRQEWVLNDSVIGRKHFI